ncbi:MAG: PrsW family glutamic-type intramembrane protease [Candidatus Jorgensenbacteria bacterium]
MVTTVFAVLVAFAPALVWLAFFLREDVHPEPKKWLSIAFFAGALASVPVFFIQWGMQGAVGAVGGGALFLVLVFAFVEEIFKFLAAYLVVRKNPVFDEPIDAMIYLVVAALGFATVENVFVMNGLASVRASFGDFIAAGTPLYTLSLRLVGATLLHALSSALVGYYWARGLSARKASRFIGLGIVAATVVHAFFNYLVTMFQETNLIYPTLFLVVAGFFVLADFERVRTRGGEPKV